MQPVPIGEPAKAPTEIGKVSQLGTTRAKIVTGIKEIINRSPQKSKVASAAEILLLKKDDSFLKIPKRHISKP